MAVEIKVLLFEKNAFFHWDQHIAAIITELNTAEKFTVNYPADRTDLSSAINSPCVGVITLYSNESFDSFKTQYSTTFASLNYRPISNNCAHAVNFTLDHFFPNEQESACWEKLYSALCCACYLGSLGLKWFPTFTTTPHEVFQKADQIEFRSIATEMTPLLH